MKTTEILISYVPRHSFTKLEVLLSECRNLTDEEMQKVCIITDMAKIWKALERQAFTVEQFEYLYDLPLYLLEAKQYDAQIALNTKIYLSEHNWNVI